MKTRNSIRAIGAIATVALAALALTPGNTSAQGGADFSRYVSVGDGFTAGYQDGALHSASQSASYPVLIAEAAGAPIVLPNLGEPGFPSPNSVSGIGLLVQRPSTCEFGSFDLATGAFEGRLNPEAAATNVAVPFQTVVQALEVPWAISPSNPNDPDSFEDVVLGYPAALHGGTPRTQITTAVAMQPTFVTFWLGPMDAFNAAVAADVNPSTLTSPEEFERKVSDALDALSSSGSKGAILNIPYVTSTALLVSQKQIRQRTGLTSKQVKNRMGVLKSSYVTIGALPTIDRIAAGTASGPLGEDEILSAQEMDRIQSTIDAYNDILAVRARALGWALVDINAIYARYEKKGVDVPLVGKLTTAYLGGLYGLDGLHPSNTGQAVIAVAVVSAINAKYGTSLPLPNVTAVAREDPHVCHTE